MSSPAQGGPSVPKEKEKKNVGKAILSRVKTVWRKADKRMSFSGKPGQSSSAAAEGAVVASATPPAEAPKPVNPAYANATKVPRAQLFEERAKKLAELYGLEMKPGEWHSTQGDALRVEKPIRMRVHRKCHICNTSFGLGKECPKCKHPRCKQCPRVPPKRTEAEREESRKKRAAIIKERAENAPIIPDWNPDNKKIVLRRPAKTGGQDLVHKKPRQRVRRTCCQCQKLFAVHTKNCGNCQHARCTDCPRDPSKKDRYPYGYPGDEFGTKTAHYECSDCKNKFSVSPAPAPTEAATCTKCSCKTTNRLKPRKVDPEPDPEVLKSLQAKIAGLKLK